MTARRLGRTSVRVSALGFGAAPIGNLYAPLDDDQKALLKSLRLALTRPNYSLSPGDVPGRLVITDSGNKGSFAS